MNEKDSIFLSSSRRRFLLYFCWPFFVNASDQGWKHYLIPLARRTRRFFCRFYQVFWLPGFRLSGSLHGEIDPRHPAEVSRQAGFQSGLCPPSQYQWQIKVFLGGSPVENDKKSWLVTGRGRNQPSSFMLVSPAKGKGKF